VPNYEAENQFFTQNLFIPLTNSNFLRVTDSK